MRPLSPQALLDLVEVGPGVTPTERSVALWSAIEPEVSETELWQAPVGCMVHALLDLRESMSGPDLELLDKCPGCEEEVEFTVSVPSLRQAQPPRENPSFDVEVSGSAIELRRVSCADLRAVERGEIHERSQLVHRCVVTEHDLDESACERVDAILGERDPQADITFAMTCQECTHGWQGTFDAGLIVWSELEVAAKRLLLEVDALARTYGWSEAEILALSPQRRSTYLEILKG